MKIGFSVSPGKSSGIGQIYPLWISKIISVPIEILAVIPLLLLNPV